MIEWLYHEISLTSSAVAYSWSKWNGEIQEKEKLFLQASEALIDEPLMEEDWKVYMATKKRAMRLKVTDFDETFEEEMAEGSEVSYLGILI